MVAPSFQGFTVLSKDPFIKGDKKFVTVQNPKTGTKRDVRWYTDSEYAKAYGKKIINTDISIPNLKEEKGFKNGPVLVVRRNQMRDEDFLRKSKARYLTGIGWYFTMDDILPSDAPEHFRYLLLGWNEFKKDDTHIKEPAKIAEILDKKASNGEWVTFK